MDGKQLLNFKPCVFTASATVHLSWRVLWTEVSESRALGSGTLSRRRLCRWHPLTPSCGNLMKQSTAACFAGGVQSASAGLALSCPKGEVSLFYASLPPKRSEAATAVPLLFSLFFLHLCHSLGAMQIHSPYPPISILRVFSLVWMGLCSGVGRIREGWMNGNAFLCVADQCAVVFSAFLIRQLLKLFNPRARPL